METWPLGWLRRRFPGRRNPRKPFAAKRPVSTVAALAATGAIVVLLAIFQYRWTGQVSRAEQERMKATLDSRVEQFRMEFLRDILRLCLRFSPSPAEPATQLEEVLARQYDDLQRMGNYPGLLKGLYVWSLNNAEGPTLLRMNPATLHLEPGQWPEDSPRLREKLEQDAGDLTTLPERAAFRQPWVLINEPTALIHPFFSFSPEPQLPRPEARLAGFTILLIDEGYLHTQYFPQMVARYFGGPGGMGYQVAILRGEKVRQTIYMFDRGLPAPRLPADAAVKLLEVPEFGWMRHRPPPIVLASPEDQWILAVQHSSGSVDAAVSALRRRNLVVSFGLLGLLAVTMGLVVRFSRQAQRLAELQMEFVAGVSHELRTPVAVICSAADNLAEGVVRQPERAREYGELIRTQGRRLAAMVEQILMFSSSGSQSSALAIQAVDVSQTLQSAVDNAAAALREAGLEAEFDLEESLEPVAANPDALRQCLENLIANAVKYAASGGQVVIRARRGGADEIRISVEDRGPGVAAEDLPHIFEPFYRGRAAREAQIHGVGLGLSLVKRIVEAMGGRVEAENRPEGGAVFTITLRTASPDSAVTQQG